MDGAFAWLNGIFQFFGRFFPDWMTFEPTQAGCKFVGQWRKPATVVYLPPGSFVIWWPARTVMRFYQIGRQTTDLRDQTLTTADDKTFSVGGVIVFEITDVIPLLTEVYQPDQTIQDICLGIMVEVLSGHTWNELKESYASGALTKQLTKEAREGLRRYGVKVIRLNISDLALCRTLRIITTQGAGIIGA
jgi:hypothetical protein